MAARMVPSESVEVQFPDGATRPVLRGASAGELLSDWDREGSIRALAATWNGNPIDLAHRIVASGTLRPLTFQDRAGRDVLQHSAAHLVAKGVTEIVPEAKPVVGPPTDEGFYYDFEMRPLTPPDLDAVQGAMQRSIASAERFERHEISKSEALRLFEGNPHKVSIVREIPENETVSYYSTGSFVDLCRGPHVPSTRWLEGIHVLGYSAIQREGAEDARASYQRVRGVAFPTKDELSRFLRLRKEAEARDHRVLGPRLELFHFSEDAPGLPFWMPKGMIVVRELERFVQEHLSKAGYSEVRTPLLFPQPVFETSGHWEHYRESIFVTSADGRPYGLKPMNCPGSMILFRSRARSYRELPLRWAEFAPLHRLEASGTVHGLTRAREFVQDDAHIFVTEEQIEPEIRTLLEWIREAFSTFRLAWTYELSTRPAHFLGDAETWDRAERLLERLLKESGIPYRVSPGEGAFYAPKIDIHIRDSLERPWQTGTIQVDYQMPRQFGLAYQGPDGALHPPVVVHRTILGSWERFFGVVLEDCAGRLPPWLSPVQVRVLPVTDRHVGAAHALAEELVGAHVRAEVAPSDETLAKRVRSAEIERIPYVAVVGDQELETGSVTVRVRGERTPQRYSRPELIDRVRSRLRSRSYEP